MKTLLFFATIFLATVSSSAVGSPKLQIKSGDQTLILDRAELEAFPQTTIVTKSPYFDGEVAFTGPTLKRIVESFGVTGEAQLTLRALNDYQVSGSLDEVLGLDAIIATRMNAQTMSIRNRGPFWVILPLSDRPELDNEDYHRYMVWQLSEIQLER